MAALVAALATAGLGVVSLAALSPRSGAAVVALLALALFVLSRAIPAVAESIASVPTAGFLTAHLARIAAVSFLIARDRPFEADLPSTRFAVGEIAVAIMAAGVLWLLSMPLERAPRSIVLWSLFGVVNAAWGLFLWSAPDVLLPRSGLILAYLGFLVPLALASHLEIARRSLAAFRNPVDGK